MPHSNAQPRYLPHLRHPDAIHMGLSPLGAAHWIENDSDIARYHQHKLTQRARRGDGVYRASPASIPAQQELASLLKEHLLANYGDYYTGAENGLHCPHGGFRTADGATETLWDCSLWVADDLIIMSPRGDQHLLTAASLCSPSQWSLAEKFGCSIEAIHAPVPKLNATLGKRIDRFLRHLRPAHPVVRFNWGLQAGDALGQWPQDAPLAIEADTPLYYRTERQSLRRLPKSGAIAFTIRVYVHPLAKLAATQGALPALFSAIDNSPAALKAYKGFSRLAPALEKYRSGAGHTRRTHTGEPATIGNKL